MKINHHRILLIQVILFTCFPFIVYSQQLDNLSQQKPFQLRGNFSTNLIGYGVSGIENRQHRKVKIYRQKDDEAEPVLITTIENSKGTFTDTQTEKETSYIYTFIAETNTGQSITVNNGVIASKL